MIKLFNNLITLQTDFLSNTGKIYSVVVGIVVIFLGITFYIWQVDKKIKKLEKQIKHEH
jgi:CcmD family protein